jgi:hypothetical protein
MIIKNEKFEIADKQHLFIDNWHVFEEHNLQRTYHQPKKFEGNPIMVPEKPWECPLIALHGSVIYDNEEGFFKMWYYSGHNVCYATSTDGVNWVKPELNVCEYYVEDPEKITDYQRLPCWDKAERDKYAGKNNNNIVLHTQPIPGDPTGLDSPTVFKDTKDPDPTRRYKLSVWINPIGQFMAEPAENYKYRMNKANPGAGRYLFYSPDGLNWTYSGVDGYMYVDHMIGDRTPIMYDETNERFIALWKMGRPDSHSYTARNGRIRGWSESKDMREWTDPVEVLWLDSFDRDDPDIYSMSGFNYGDMYIGIMEVFYRTPDRQVLDLQLTTSHNGRHWDRIADRSTFLPLGEDNDWDTCNHSAASSPPVEVEGELWFYYSGRGHRHDIGSANAKPENSGGIGIYKLRKDGFASIDAGETEGSFFTKSIEVTGPEMFINANVKEGGYIKVAVHDIQECAKPPKARPSDEAAEGFDISSSIAVNGDSLSHKISWENGSLSSKLANKIHLKFIMKNVELYSFRFAD